MGRINMDFKVSADTLHEISEAVALIILSEWPYTNSVGNCWCGHSNLSHGNDENFNCVECQCTGFTLDTWAKEISNG
jgi:hypothetical protein